MATATLDLGATAPVSKIDATDWTRELWLEAYAMARRMIRDRRTSTAATSWTWFLQHARRRFGASGWRIAQAAGRSVFDARTVSYATTGSVEAPWCTDQRDGRTDPHPRPSSRDADGLRAPELQHPVQDVDADGDLGRLAAVRARPERVADHPLVTGHGRLGQRAAVVPRGFLPAQAAVLGDEPQVPVALRGRGLGRPAWHRALARRHDHRRLGVAFGDGVVHVLPVVGAVAGERRHRSLELVEQGPDAGAVVGLARGQLHGLDPPGDGVHPEVQLAPGPTGAGSVLLGQPLAGPAQLQARAVDQQVQRPATRA